MGQPSSKRAKFDTFGTDVKLANYVSNYPNHDLVFPRKLPIFCQRARFKILKKSPDNNFKRNNVINNMGDKRKTNTAFQWETRSETRPETSPEAHTTFQTNWKTTWMTT